MLDTFVREDGAAIIFRLESERCTRKLHNRPMFYNSHVVLHLGHYSPLLLFHLLACTMICTLDITLISAIAHSTNIQHDEQYDYCCISVSSC